MPDYRARLRRYSHNLSHKYTFTCPCGPLLPTFETLVSPGDTFSCESDIFIRTNPLLTAAMADMKFHLEWFFVPLPMIYTAFESLAWNTQDLISSLYQGRNIVSDNWYLPLLDIKKSMQNMRRDDEDPIYHGLAHNVSYVGGNETTADIHFPQIHGFECFGKSAYRLLDMLKFNPGNVSWLYWDGTQSNFVGSTYMPAVDVKVFPWALFAYHAIYYKHYRLEDYEQDTLSWRNADRYAGLDNAQTFDISSANGFFACHYRPRRKDYFLSAMRSPMINTMSSLSGGYSVVTKNSFPSLSGGSNGLDSYTDALINIYDIDSGDPSSVGNMGQSPVTQVGDFTSTSQLRYAFAIEKMMRVIGRADKDYDSQVLAHFGFRVPRDVKHNYQFIGAVDGQIHIGEVIQTATTSEAPLGDIAGKGYGTTDNNKRRRVKFRAPCHGVIMGIFSIEPDVDYAGGFDRIHAFTGINDLYQPEYDNLGFQPLFAYETSPVSLHLNGYSAAINGKRFGWQYRYQQWKKKYNRISMAFYSPERVSTSQDSYAFNDYSSWIISRAPFGQRYDGVIDYYDYYPTVADMYVCPKDTDNIFALKFNQNWSHDYYQNPWQMYKFDPFIVQIRFNSYLNSVMSKTGDMPIDSI